MLVGHRLQLVERLEELLSPVSRAVVLALRRLGIEARALLNMRVALDGASEEPATERVEFVERDVVLAQDGEEVLLYRAVQCVVDACNSAEASERLTLTSALEAVSPWYAVGLTAKQRVSHRLRA